MREVLGVWMNKPEYFSVSSEINGLADRSFHGGGARDAAILRSPQGEAGWRRGRDSNPREAFDLYSLSRGAPSTTRPPLRRRGG